MLRLGVPVIGVSDMGRAVAFWCAALDLKPADRHRSNSWTTLEHADGSGRAMGLQLSESCPEAHPRVHVDLFVDDAAEQAAAVERLVELGATRLDWDMYPPEPDFVVLADPDGNAFCIVNLGASEDA